MDDLLRRCEQSVLSGDREEACRLAATIAERGLDVEAAIDEGFARGMRRMGDRWAVGHAFLPEVAFSAEAMKAALEVLRPQGRDDGHAPRVVIGTVAGDIHDIGKTLVGIMLAAHGYDVLDLGVDVADESFLEAARDARVLGLSALLTTTMPCQRRVLERLESEGLRGGIRVLIGGAPTSATWAEHIGADGYAENAVDAVRVVDSLIGRRESVA